MNFSRRPLRVLYLCLLVTPVPGFAESADAQIKSAGYVCVPSADGEGWDCEENRGQKPQVKMAPVSEAVPPASTESASDVAEPPPDTGLDPLTGLSLDPDDWYTPTPPRAVEPSHQLVADLPASLYVIQAGDGFCPGDYRERDYPFAPNVKNEEYPVVALADQLSTELDVSAELHGNVTLEQGNRLIVGNQAQLDYATNTVEFPEGVRIDQPGLVMQGQYASVQLDSSEVQLQGVQFILRDADLRGEAGNVEQNPAGDLRLQKTDFTRCEPANNGWSMSTSQLVVEDDAIFGKAKHAVLRLKSVPVFYSPYLSFPVSDERVSGFLFPTMGYSDENGAEFSIPYYLNLAPDYDATVTPVYISERGAGGELELRHMSSWQTTMLGGAFLPDDDLYNGRLERDDYDEAGGEPVLGPFEPADRWLGAIDHRGRIGRFRTMIDYTNVSDREYFRDFDSGLEVSSRRALERRGEIRYNQGGLSMRLWAQGFQRLDAIGVDEYQRLPEIEMNYTRSLLGPLQLDLETIWSEFDRDTDGLVGTAAITGSRTHVEPRLRLPMSWPFGFLNLMGGYRYTVYDLEQDDDALGPALADDSPDRNIGLANLDGGLFFERDLNLFGEDLIQTLEPRVYYLWQEFDDQSTLPNFDAAELTFGYSQLFRDNRFSGRDRIGDANQASAGVTTRFLSRSSGREYFRFSVGEIFYFEDRDVTLRGPPRVGDTQSSSAIAAEMSAALLGAWQVTGDVVWDPHDNQVDESGVGIQYRRDNRHIFNVGYRNRVDRDIEQTELSLYWPFMKGLAVIARWNHDLVSGRTIEGFGGLEYNDCCLQVRLLARHFLDSPTTQNFDDVEADDGIFLQIVFKGLAGFGTKVESVLERGIRGYRAPLPQDYFDDSY